MIKGRGRIRVDTLFRGGMEGLIVLLANNSKDDEGSKSSFLQKIVNWTFYE